MNMKAPISATFKTVLVLGGACSGKSRYGLTLAERLPGPRLFLATGEARDEEMVARITAHQAERGPDWETQEVPRALPEAISTAGEGYGVILVDCLTMWLANLMLSENAADDQIRSAVQHLLAVLERLSTPAIFISNEVGLGVVPESPLARKFRDELGRLHQQVAQAADLVVLVVAGLPVAIKGK